MRGIHGPLFVLVVAVAASRVHAGILDNSFFIEEAYNQEARVVQHIQTIHWTRDRRDGETAHAFTYAITQEWPLGGQRHQLSYTIPYRRAGCGGRTSGIGDVQVHYRLQALEEHAKRPALAPRFSIILPTGNEDRGLGAGTPGVQVNLPASKKVARVHFHLNAGASVFPDARITLASGARSPRHDLLATNLGFSAILLMSERLNFLLELATSTEESIGASGETEEEVLTLISPGLRFAIDRKDGGQWVFGAAVPLGLSDAEDDSGMFLYTSFEHPF
jgi:hypothetical protein